MKNLIGISVIVLLTAAGLGGCRGGGGMADGLLTVDVTAGYPVKELVLQDFMDVEYVALETTDEFLTQGHVMAVDDNIIIVKNYVNDGDIFIFDRATGKGLRKINRKGQGGEEYTYALGVVLDEDRGEMFVNDHSARKILVYDLEGNFKRSFRHKEGATYANVCNFDRGNLICYDGHVSNDGEANEQLFMIASKEDGSITKDILIPFEKKILTDIIVKDGNGMTWGASPSNHYPVIPCFDGFILTEASSDTIYTYSLDCVMTPFIVRTPPARSMDPVVFLFPSIITGRYYFMSALKREYDFDKNEGFPDVDLMYDREEKAIYKPTVYNDDYTGGQEIDMKTRPVSGEIVTRQLLQSDRLVEDFKAGKLKGRLAEIAAGLDEESNPVIMLVKHKK